jgi:TusA-related sulfurtransferase
MNFTSTLQTDIPKGRNGKHRQIVSMILSDLEKLAPGRALKIPLSELPDSKENIRSALNRVTRQRKMGVATSGDDTYFYVWKTEAAPQS